MKDLQSFYEHINDDQIKTIKEFSENLSNIELLSGPERETARKAMLEILIFSFKNAQVISRIDSMDKGGRYYAKALMMLIDDLRKL